MNFTKVGCVAFVMYFPLGWVKCEMNAGGQNSSLLSSGFLQGKEELFILDPADSETTGVEHVCVCSGKASD